MAALEDGEMNRTVLSSRHRQYEADYDISMSRRRPTMKETFCFFCDLSITADHSGRRTPDLWHDRHTSLTTTSSPRPVRFLFCSTPLSRKLRPKLNSVFHQVLLHNQSDNHYCPVEKISIHEAMKCYIACDTWVCVIPII